MPTSRKALLDKIGFEWLDVEQQGVDNNEMIPRVEEGASAVLRSQGGLSLEEEQTGDEPNPARHVAEVNDGDRSVEETTTDAGKKPAAQTKVLPSRDADSDDGDGEGVEVEAAASTSEAPLVEGSDSNDEFGKGKEVYAAASTSEAPLFEGSGSKNAKGKRVTETSSSKRQHVSETGNSPVFVDAAPGPDDDNTSTTTTNVAARSSSGLEKSGGMTAVATYRDKGDDVSSLPNRMTAATAVAACFEKSRGKGDDVASLPDSLPTNTAANGSTVENISGRPPSPNTAQEDSEQPSTRVFPKKPSMRLPRTGRKKPPLGEIDPIS